MKYLVLSSNLNADSSTAEVARAVAGSMTGSGVHVDLLDLSSVEMPWCDGRVCYTDPRTSGLTARVAAADGIVVCSPVYNYTFNAALQNFIELTDQAWVGKTVGFACTAGGPASYMAIMSCANALMLDYRCVIVPRFVYVTRDSFTDRKLTDKDVVTRLQALGHTVVSMAQALAPLRNATPG